MPFTASLTSEFSVFLSERERERERELKTPLKTKIKLPFLNLCSFNDDDIQSQTIQTPNAIQIPGFSPPPLRRRSRRRLHSHSLHLPLPFPILSSLSPLLLQPTPTPLSLTSSSAAVARRVKEVLKPTPGTPRHDGGGASMESLNGSPPDPKITAAEITAEDCLLVSNKRRRQFSSALGTVLQRPPPPLLRLRPPQFFHQRHRGFQLCFLRPLNPQ